MRLVSFALSLLADLAGLLHRRHCDHEPGPWTYPPMCRWCGATLPNGG